MAPPDRPPGDWEELHGDRPDQGLGPAAARLRELEDQLAAEGVRIRDKTEVWHQRWIGAALRLLTLGGQARYLDGYVTTIGPTIYVPPGWARRSEAARYLTLRHERVHLEQFRRFGLVPMVLAYLLLPLPVGLAWCRMRLERQAYAESLRASFELGGYAAAAALRAPVIAQFVGPGYAWMWPFPRAIGRWFDATLEALERQNENANENANEDENDDADELE